MPTIHIHWRVAFCGSVNGKCYVSVLEINKSSLFMLQFISRINARRRGALIPGTLARVVRR